MPSGYPAVTPEVKDQIINRIKENGERVPEIAKEFGIRPKLIYGWLASRNGGSGEILELSKLKRERETLLAIIGELTVANKYRFTLDLKLILDIRSVTKLTVG